MAQAQTAADAAALAGARHHRVAAAELAGANGATLAAFETSANRASVVVTLGALSAAASAATAGPEAAPALAAALSRAGDLLGEDLTTSVRLLGRYGADGVLVPRPVAGRLVVLEHRTGLCRAAGGGPLHFVVCPATHRR